MRFTLYLSEYELRNSDICSVHTVESLGLLSLSCNRRVRLSILCDHLVGCAEDRGELLEGPLMGALLYVGLQVVASARVFGLPSELSALVQVLHMVGFELGLQMVGFALVPGLQDERFELELI